MGTAVGGGATKKVNLSGARISAFSAVRGLPDARDRSSRGPHPGAAAAARSYPARPMSDLSDNAKVVLQSLSEQPTLNTPSLIATGPIAGRIDKPEIEQALGELVDSGRVVHRPTGWKLKPGT